ncbi:MAG: hypothetical protein R2690_15525 [Acidimicrobiales bacterium]
MARLGDDAPDTMTPPDPTHAPDATHALDPTQAPDPITPVRLAHDLRSLVVDALDDLVAHHLPRWRVPGTYGGHRVEPDVPADLVYTLGHLADTGVETVAGTPIDDAIARVLARLDGPGTHTFFSYRVAETLARYGPFATNTLIAGWDDAARANLVAACDSSEWISLLDEGILPRNYAAVLARCELGRLRLGLLDDGAVVDDLVARLRTVLAANPRRYLDDSNGSVGRYDIYTADVWLFTEPLADRLGPLWDEGLARALALVETVASPDGTAVPWGRSTGILGAALTIELAALALDDRTAVPGRWLALAAAATAAMPAWFADGVTTAYRHRSPYGYRGTFRRLQLTLDILGKLAWAADRLAALAAPTPPTAIPGSTPRRARTVVGFADERPAAVWAVDGPAVGFVVPFVGATRSDYLPAPHRPGLFEVPVDSDIACWTPLVFHKGKRFALAGEPDELEVLDEADGVRATWDGLVPIGDLDPPADVRRLAGSGALTWRADGRTVTMTAELSFAEVPQAVTVLVPEVDGRPLRVVATTDASTTAVASVVDTTGVAEWRSFWGPLPAVHQIDLDPAGALTVRVDVTPKLRVSSSAHGHHYDASLYRPLADRVVELPPVVGAFALRRARIDAVDVFHLHWPEWVVLDDLTQHERAIATLATAGVPIVWTAHNLTPHDKRHDVHDPAYRLGVGRRRRHPPLGLGPRPLPGALARSGRCGAPRHPPRALRRPVRPVAHPVARRARGRRRLVAVHPAARARRRSRATRSTSRRCSTPSPPAGGATCSWRAGRSAPTTSCPTTSASWSPSRTPWSNPTATPSGWRCATCWSCRSIPTARCWPPARPPTSSAWGRRRSCRRGGTSPRPLGGAGIPGGHTVEALVEAIDALDTDAVAAARAAAVELQAATAWPVVADATMAVFEQVVGTDARRARRR